MRKGLCLIIILMLAALVSCGASGADLGASQGAGSSSENILLPPLSGIDRELVDFTSLSYSPPDADGIIERSAELSSLVKSNSIEYDAAVEKILEIDLLYADLDTMCSLLVIRSSENLHDSQVTAEYERLQTRLPSVERALDELLVTLAASPYAQRLEDEVFGEGFIEEYSDGSRFTDYIVSLLEEESALKAEYLTLDKEAARSRGADIFIELLKVRKRLADAYGHSSYAEYAYESLGHDYTAEEMSDLTRDISKFALPIYTALSQRAFSGYFKTHRPPAVGKAEVINELYEIFSALDEDIGNTYSYMLNGSLYSVAPISETRRDGAFTVYMTSAEIPFVFVSLDGTVNDYMLISHEFGHFYDDFTNYGLKTSLDLCEVSSQALALLALTEFKDVLDTEEYKYLYFTQMKQILEALIIQGFYARFEALAYELPYEEISRESLDGLVVRAAKEMNLNLEVFNDLSDAVIIHMIDTPFYVQSYCTSLIAALDIFFKECDADGEGIAAYKALIRGREEYDFTEALARAGIASPFTEDIVKQLANKIHLSILGSHYYTNANNYLNAV